MFCMQEVEIPYHTRNAGLCSSPKMGSGMENQRPDAKLFTADHLIGQGEE